MSKFKVGDLFVNNQNGQYEGICQVIKIKNRGIYYTNEHSEYFMHINSDYCNECEKLEHCETKLWKVLSND